MMNKKLIALILGLGALVALGLGVFLSIKTKDIKLHLEKTLNEKFESFVQESGYITEWEPFSCSGLVNIGCYSPKIVATDGEGILTLKNMGFDIDSMDNASLQASLNIKDITLGVKDIDKEDKDLKENLALFSSFFPNNVRCNISLKQNDDKLAENLQCTIAAKNATYQIQGVDTYQHDGFKTQNIAQILQEFYFDAFVNEESSTHFEEYKYALDNVMFKVKDNGLSKDLYKYYELQSNAQGLPVSQEGFEQNAKNVNMLATIGLSLIMGEAYHNEIIELGNALESLVLGKSKELGFSFKHKADSQEEFVSLKEFLLNPYASYLADNFTFEIISQ